jgi:NitT/TauT family transport system substrate-binding protein
VHIVNANALKQKHDVMQRFMDAYRETYEFLYSDPRGVKIFSEYSKVPENLAIQIRDKFMPKAVESPEKVSGLDQIMADAITFKQLSAPLTRAQLADLIQIPPKR